MTIWILLTDEEKYSMGWSGWNTELDNELEMKERELLKEWWEKWKAGVLLKLGPHRLCRKEEMGNVRDAKPRRCV